MSRTDTDFPNDWVMVDLPGMEATEKPTASTIEITQVEHSRKSPLRLVGDHCGMRVYVKYNEKIHCILVNSLSTILELKQAIEKQIGILPKNQSLWTRGIRMEDNKNFMDYNIQKNTQFECHFTFPR